MPEPIVEDDAFDEEVEIPLDSEDVTHASVLLYVQPIVNRTRKLWNLLRGSGALTELEEHVFMVALEPAQSSLDGADSPTWVTVANGWLEKRSHNSGNDIAYIPLPLRRGQTLTKVEALVLNAHATPMSMTLQRFGPANFATPATPAITNVDDVDAPASVGAATLELEVAEEDTDTRDTTWRLAIQGSAAASGDRIYGVRVTVLDPGPRNF